MKTLSVISRKGGAGKTTIAVNLAIAAHLAGHKTMIADIDPQRSASDSLRGRLTDGPTLMESSAGKLFLHRSTAQHDRYAYLFIDTPVAPDADVAVAVNCSDVCILVCRPTFLDIASVARSADAVRRLGKAGLIVLNQAPAKRLGEEPMAVIKAVEALRFCGLPVAPIGLRSRAAFQTSIAHGLSAMEWNAQDAAGQEVSRLWSHLETVAPSGRGDLQIRAN